MTLDLNNISKTDLYASLYAEMQDLGQRLARQFQINQVLRDENMKLANHPCLECDMVTPALREQIADLEAHLETACELLNKIDAETVSLTYGAIVGFIRDRRELNAARKPSKGANSPV